MYVSLPYGKTSLQVRLPEDVEVDVIDRPKIPPAQEVLGLVRSALENPLGGINLPSFGEARSVAIAISDQTRPVPYEQLLPPLLGMLSGAGITSKAITFFIALGTHPPMEPYDIAALVPGSVYKRYRVVSHDAHRAENLVHLGETSRGTPVLTNREFAESDLKIVIGTIEPHQFAGFSGGVKSAAIGLGGMETISRNHALMTHPEAHLGAHDSNPLRQDIEEIGRMIGVQFALNAVLNQGKQIVHVLAGDPLAVMEAGVPLAKQVCQVAVPMKYSLVVASPGGHPKDINLYQAQKGLAHAALVTRPGGTIILAAACPEGTGSSAYEHWSQDKESYEAIIRRFTDEGFRIGPHKAYQIARDASLVSLKFYSDMDINLSEALLLNPVEDLQMAVDTALDELKVGERVGILPHAASTIPYLNTPQSEE
jgi:nickel-dependent lactate racemase